MFNILLFFLCVQIKLFHCHCHCHCHYNFQIIDIEPINSIQDICDLCNSYDLTFLQENWLLNKKLHLLSNIHVYSDFEGFGTSAIDSSNSMFSGRPHGGVVVRIRKSIRKAC